MMTEAPNKSDARNFWNEIWSKEGSLNEGASWIEDYKEFVEDLEVEQMEDIVIKPEDVSCRIKKMSNWKAPGLDGVRGFWFKQFKFVHPRLVVALGNCLESGEVPEWMVNGRTFLIQKDPSKGSIASNYRPIACLPLMWKLLTGIFSDKIYTHLESNGLLPEEQKGCRKGSKGTKDQLLIDKAVQRQVKKKHSSLSIAWIDYRKAFDLVPHKWILDILCHTKVAGNLGRLISKSMADWKTDLTFNSESICSVDIKRGIFRVILFLPFCL